MDNYLSLAFLKKIGKVKNLSVGITNGQEEQHGI